MKLLIILLVAIASVESDLAQDFQERVESFILTNLQSDNCDIWIDILRLEYGVEEYFCQESFTNAAEQMLNRGDGVDFRMAAISWLVNKHWNNAMLTEEFRTNMSTAIIQLPFWLNETGDLKTMQYWSENHQIGWNSGKYLISQAFATLPDLMNVTFEASNESPLESMAVGKSMVDRWLNYRARFGFSEFNSDTYGPIAFKALASVVALAEDDQVKLKASMVMNLQIFDQILGSKGRRIASARGRAYSSGKIEYRQYEFLYLIKGLGDPPVGHAESAMFVLALKNGYEFPMALLQIAQEEIENDTFELKEKFGLSPNDGPSEGILKDNAEDCIFWFSNGAYFDPASPECIFIVGDSYHLWNRTEIWKQVSLAKPIWDLSPQLVHSVGQQTAPIGGGSTLGSADMYTFRSPHFMLSSVKNYHPGYVIGQQHPWQATLDESRNGTFFSHQPIRSASPNSAEYWEDYWIIGIHPKIGQFKSTLISLHNPEILNTLLFGIEKTHANIKMDQFDDFYMDQHWIMGSQKDGFVAMYSDKAFEALDSDDLVAKGVQNVWICEVGSKATHGSFDGFKEFHLNSTVEVTYAYDDSFIECMVDNDCLNSFATFFQCLLETCSQSRYPTSAVSGCVSQNQYNNFDEADLTVLKTCLENKRADIQVKYHRFSSSDIFTFGWQEDLQLNGVVVQNMTEKYPRYENAFAQVPWGSRVFNISSRNYSLHMDFENLSMT